MVVADRNHYACRSAYITIARCTGKLASAGVKTCPAGFVGDAVGECIAGIYIRTCGREAIDAALVDTGGWRASDSGRVVGVSYRQAKTCQIGGGAVVVADSNDYACRNSHITVARRAGKRTVAGVETRPAGFIGNAVAEGIAGIYIRTCGREAVNTALVHAGGRCAGYGGRVVGVVYREAKARQVGGGAVVVTDRNHYACRGAHITAARRTRKRTGAGVETRPGGFIGDAVRKRIAGIYIRTCGREAIGTALVYVGGRAARDSGSVVGVSYR